MGRSWPTTETDMLAGSVATQNSRKKPKNPAKTENKIQNLNEKVTRAFYFSSLSGAY